jgi:hypothetical protein
VTAPNRSNVTRSPHASTSPLDVAERILMPKKFPVPPELSRGWYLDADGRRVAFQVGHVAKLVFARFSPDAVDEADPVPLDVIARELGRDDLAAIRRALDELAHARLLTSAETPTGFRLRVTKLGARFVPNVDTTREPAAAGDAPKGAA